MDWIIVLFEGERTWPWIYYVIENVTLILSDWWEPRKKKKTKKLKRVLLKYIHLAWLSEYFLTNYLYCKNVIDRDSNLHDFCNYYCRRRPPPPPRQSVFQLQIVQWRRVFFGSTWEITDQSAIAVTITIYTYIFPCPETVLGTWTLDKTFVFSLQ